MASELMCGKIPTFRTSSREALAPFPRHRSNNRSRLISSSLKIYRR
jgi:hypothetical protein